MAGVVVVSGLPSPIKLMPDGPKAKGYKEAFPFKAPYVDNVLSDLMPRLAARDKGSPKGNRLASVEDRLTISHGNGTIGELFTNGYVDGVYAYLDEPEGGRRRGRKTRKTRSRRRRTTRRTR